MIPVEADISPHPKLWIFVIAWESNYVDFELMKNLVDCRCDRDSISIWRNLVGGTCLYLKNITEILVVYDIDGEIGNSKV